MATSSTSKVMTQADWTPADDGMLQQLKATAKAMIISVAKTGSSHFNPDVIAFQRQWNVSKAMIIKALAIVKGWSLTQASPYFVSLAEDGGYGKHTGTALNMLITPGPAAPLTASQMTLYYANNADFVGGLSSPTTVVPPALHNTSSPSTSTAHTSPQVVAATAAYVPNVTKPASVSTSKVVVTKKPAAGTVKKMNPPIPKQTVPNVQNAQVLDFTQDKTPTTVVATPVGTDYKLIAVGVGGLALGGVLFWMLKRSSKSHRKAA